MANHKIVEIGVAYRLQWGGRGHLRPLRPAPRRDTACLKWVPARNVWMHANEDSRCHVGAWAQRVDTHADETVAVPAEYVAA